MVITKKRRIIELVVAVCAIILFAFLYINVLGVYESEDAASATAFSTGEANSENKVDINVKVMSVDPVKGEMAVRMQFTPMGEYLGDDGTNLACNLVLSLNSATGKEETVFKKDERMNPMDVVISLDGKASDYPFDEHSTAIMIALQKPVVVEDVEDGQKTSYTDYEDVPISVNYTGAVTGYKIAATEAVDKEVGFCEIDIEISRSLTVQSFAIFIMFLKWALAAGALFVALAVIVRKRKIEFGMFSWLAALLFALPPLRNAMPAVPPIGTLSDFISFFWAEGIVALSLSAIVLTWLIRPNPNK